MTEPTWINLRVVQAFHDRQIMSMAPYRGFEMRDCFCLPYQGLKAPTAILAENQT